MSDQQNIFKPKSYQEGGAIVMVFKKKADLKYKFGIYYNSEFFGPFLLPLLGIDWNATPKLNVFGVLPGSMNVEYKLYPAKFHIGLAFKSSTASSRSKDSEFIKVTDNHLKCFSDLYVFKKHVITLEAGYSMYRKYQKGIRINGENEIMDLNVPDGFLFRMGYSYRIRTDNK